jgi:molybdenum cofactor synthesis domain-containing protein
MYGLAILTVSTSGYQGQRQDTGSEAIKEALPPPEYEVVRYEIVSDDKEMIAERMAQWADSPDVDLVVSTGGTGLGPRDVTPEACLSILDKEVPGLAEAMRAETLKFTPMAMLSRSVAGIRGSTLIITLPGSPRGVKETLEVVKPVLPHAIELLKKESVYEHPR